MTNSLYPRLVDVHATLPPEPFQAGTPEEEERFLSHVRAGVLGADASIPGPFGDRPLRYFDFIASGRFFRDVEDELNERVLPLMANTHTESNYTGRQVTRMYEGALKRIGRHLNASADDVLIPVGSGSTGAINRLIHVLGLRVPDQLEDRWHVRDRIPEEARPVIFRSLMEHHSNDVAWRETLGDSVYVGFDESGRVSPADLEEKLHAYRHRPWKIGTFSAASNVTGILNDVPALARTLHRAGAWAFFDWAAAGPYVPIDMHPEGDPDARMDAAFFSVHKFLGGPRTPGLLVANRELFTNRVPAEPGGGTVLYTSPWDHRYLSSIAHRETGGTPPIVQTIQAGLAFDLKAALGTERIERVEQGFLRRALRDWTSRDGLIVLGNTSTHRLGVVSLVFRDLHHNFVAALLNDRFGIQVRAGCMCAGPYGHMLLHIDEGHSAAIRQRLDEGHAAEKPGWVRVSFSPTVSESEFQALLEGVDHVLVHGRRELDQYQVDDKTGDWVRKAPSQG